MTGIAGVVLAGGRGERLGGVVKGDLLVGGIRLLERVIETFGDVRPLLIAHGALPSESLAFDPRYVGLPDLPGATGGPLAGLAAAAHWARLRPISPHILVLAAVDTPFLPPDYVARLIAPLDTARAAIASHNGTTYPTSSAWRLDALAGLPAATGNDRAPRSLKHLGTTLGAVTVPFPSHAGGDPFANANTMADLLALQRRATTGRP